MLYFNIIVSSPLYRGCYYFGGVLTVDTIILQYLKMWKILKYIATYCIQSKN